MFFRKEKCLLVLPLVCAHLDWGRVSRVQVLDRRRPDTAAGQWCKWALSHQLSRTRRLSACVGHRQSHRHLVDRVDRLWKAVPRVILPQPSLLRQTSHSCAYITPLFQFLCNKVPFKWDHGCFWEIILIRNNIQGFSICFRNPWNGVNMKKWYIYDIYIICANEAKPCVFTNAGTRLWTEVSRCPTPDPQPDIASDETHPAF